MNGSRDPADDLTPAKVAPHWSTWLALAAGLVTFVGSFLNFWSGSVDGTSGGITAWSKWWWLPAMVALVATVLIVLRGLRLAPRVAASVGNGLAALSFGLSIAVLVHTFVVDEVCQAGVCLVVDQLVERGASVGPASGIWLTVIMTAALTGAGIRSASRAE